MNRVLPLVSHVRVDMSQYHIDTVYDTDGNALLYEVIDLEGEIIYWSYDKEDCLEFIDAR